MKLFKILGILLFISVFASISFGQTPITPLDASSAVLQITASVTWTDFDDGNGNGPYDVEFDNDPAFGSVDASAASTASTSLALPALLYNSTYYWRVRDTDIDGALTDGAWHSYSFTTEISTPAVTAPTGYDGILLPIVNWTFAGGTSGVTFDVEYDDGGGYAPEVSGLAGASVTHTFTTTLTYNTDYTIRVTANKGGESTSHTTTFKTLLATPVLTAPSNGSSSSDRTPTLTWTQAGNVSDVVYDIAVPGATPAAVSNNATTSYTFVADQAYGNYSWTVTAQDDNGGGTENSDKASATWTYDVVPTLTAPGNTLTGISLFPTFSWIDDGVSSYTVEVSTSPTFATTLASEVVGAGVSSYQFSEAHASGAFPLNNSTVYYWRVIASGVNSAIWSFTTVAGISIGVGNPAHGSEVYQYDPLYFSWYIAQAQGSIKFRLEILASATDPATSVWNAGPWAFSVDNISSVYRTVTGLLGGTKYWWRLIGYIDTNTDNVYDPAFDKVVIFSQHYSFTTKGGAVTAYPSWPIGGNKVYTLTPMFGWYTTVYEPSVTYKIIVATDATLTGGYLQTGVIGTYPAVAQSGTIYTIPGGELTYSTTYYWQVVAYYNGTPTYSSVASFITYDDASAVVNKPVISYPTGGATIYTDSPTLYWWGNAYGSSINYSVEYSTTGGAPYAVWNTTSGDQFLAVSGLTAGQTYTWIVIADKGGLNQTTSDPATFTVAGGSTSYPVPTFPTGGVMVYSSTPSLGWYVSGSTLGWSGYYVKWVKTTGAVADWAAESGTIINDINQTSVQVSPALEEGESYKWAVALYDGVTPPVHADYVETSFSVYGGASSITINQSTPVNGATNIPTNVNFYWWVSGVTTSVTGYYVQYSPYADPNLDPDLATNISSTSTNLFTSLNLSGGTTYKWRVVANLTSGGPVYSGWYEFTTITTSAAVQPTAGSPSNGVTIGTDRAELSWFTKAAPNENQTYEVEVSESPKFESIKLRAESESNSLKVNELDDGQYFWRVKGKNSEGESYYSNIASFKVGNGITDVTDLTAIPEQFEVSQNYPNPFNPTTVIKFGLSEASFVSIKIYNMLGQEVKTLVNSDKSSGSYSVQWNGDNNYGQKVTSGTYLYRVTAENSVVTKKMILLK